LIVYFSEARIFTRYPTHRVHIAGCTEHPTSGWVTQQARQLCWTFEDQPPAFQYLLHDRDTKFTAAFDQVFAAQNIEVIRTPIRAPNANAYAERWVRSIPQECLNQLITINERHLNSVLQEYIAYCNTKRPHQGLNQRYPETSFESANIGTINCRRVPGGLINDSYGEVA
jgi:putative transposase